MIERAPKLFLQIVQNRIKLFSIELEEETIRVKREIALVIVGSILGMTGLIGICLLIVYLVPDEARVLVASIIVATFIIASLVILIIARRFAREHTPLEATLATLNKDIYDV